jgi:hypothetical protein
MGTSRKMEARKIEFQLGYRYNFVIAPFMIMWDGSKGLESLRLVTARILDIDQLEVVNDRIPL